MVDEDTVIFLSAKNWQMTETRDMGHCNDAAEIRYSAFPAIFFVS
jgi:hypothetical protein